MKKWKQKAIVQKITSFLPFKNKINYLFQKYVTKGINLRDEYFYDRLGHASEHLKIYKKYSGKDFPDTCLEIGTGWHPTVPISFFLAGTHKTYSVDISFLTSKERIYDTLQKFLQCQKENKLKAIINYRQERMDAMLDLVKNYETLSLEEILKKLNITYLIEDARKLSLPDDSIDLVNSNNTFEHIYPLILSPILKEFKRVVKKRNGVMSHFIDMSDHFAHFDNSISIYNYLKYSNQKWKWIDNSIQPQNRLRIYEYKKIYSDLNIPINEETFRPGNVEELKTIQMDAQYQGHPLEEIAKSHCHFISKM